MKTDLPRLPVNDAEQELLSALSRHKNLVVVAEPGAGKTTRLPVQILNSPLFPTDRSIFMLEPRRLAARSAAARIAQEQNWRLGDQVGYQVRFDRKWHKGTRLVLLTEALLAQHLVKDPELSHVGAVVLDEFHERSVHTDLAIGLLTELQQLSRPDLRIVVMSATMDAERVSRYLGDAPILNIAGRTHPVSIQLQKKPQRLETGEDWIASVTESIVACSDGQQPSVGDWLVFVPGAGEIRRLEMSLYQSRLRDAVHIHALHGSLPLEAQAAVLQRPSDQKRKIILATNIAETSLTIDGVGTVIDTGLARVAEVDENGFSRLTLKRISRASAKQRAGRAGRQQPGFCYRLWNSSDEASMADFETPEILRTDLTEIFLTLLALKIDPSSFTWFQEPDKNAARRAFELIEHLGLRLSGQSALSERGRLVQQLPVPSRIGAMLIEAGRANRSLEVAAEAAALLSERDLFGPRFDSRRYSQNDESDIAVRLRLLRSSSHARGRSNSIGVNQSVEFLSSESLSLVRKVKESLVEAVENARASSVSKSDERFDYAEHDEDETLSRLLLAGFSDRVARRRQAHTKKARMVGGSGVELAATSAVERSELFLVLQTTDTKNSSGLTVNDPTVAIACGIRKEWLREQFPKEVYEKREVSWSESSKAVTAHVVCYFRDLAIEEPRPVAVDPELACELLKTKAIEHWQDRFAGQPHFQNLRLRAELLVRANLMTREQYEKLFISKLAPENRDDWRIAMLDELCFNESRLEEVLAKPLNAAALRFLPNDVTQSLNEHAPEAINVPSGSRIPLIYREGLAPVLEVRIQEIFGMQISPQIARKNVTVVISLLAPNFRPVQVTSDLASFWATGYSEVRKELRLRYPKHSWPEDPRGAKPEAKGRRNK